jgi:hypothetical protein
MQDLTFSEIVTMYIGLLVFGLGCLHFIIKGLTEDNKRDKTNGRRY